jgi:hypothetical protein
MAGRMMEGIGTGCEALPFFFFGIEGKLGFSASLYIQGLPEPATAEPEPG